MDLELTIQIMHFIAESLGGSVSKRKLMILLYIIDRTSIEKYSYPMTDDEYAWCNQNPFLIQASQVIDDYSNCSYTKIFKQIEFCNLFGEVEIKNLLLKQNGSSTEDVDNFDFDLFSIASREIITQILEQFGQMSDEDLDAYVSTPQHFPEAPEASTERIDLPLESILIHLGYNDEEIKHIAEEINYYKRLRALKI